MIFVNLKMEIRNLDFLKRRGWGGGRGVGAGNPDMIRSISSWKPGIWDQYLAETWNGMLAIWAHWNFETLKLWNFETKKPSHLDILNLCKFETKKPWNQTPRNQEALWEFPYSSTHRLPPLHQTTWGHEGTWVSQVVGGRDACIALLIYILIIDTP